MITYILEFLFLLSNPIPSSVIILILFIFRQLKLRTRPDRWTLLAMFFVWIAARVCLSLLQLVLAGFLGYLG